MTTGIQPNQECNFYSGKITQPRLVTDTIGPTPTRYCIDFLVGEAPHLSHKFVSSLLVINGLCDHTILIFIDCQP